MRKRLSVCALHSLTVRQILDSLNSSSVPVLKTTASSRNLDIFFMKSLEMIFKKETNLQLEPDAFCPGRFSWREAIKKSCSSRNQIKTCAFRIISLVNIRVDVSYCSFTQWLCCVFVWIRLTVWRLEQETWNCCLETKLNSVSHKTFVFWVRLTDAE